ncbi:MAG: InlB B-repeat-containing protein, partial [Firmicutes bacterium]|nr:InlB B-repeat-containing protein [Bacillota bacterium]
SPVPPSPQGMMGGMAPPQMQQTPSGGSVNGIAPPPPPRQSAGNILASKSQGSSASTVGKDGMASVAAAKVAKGVPKKLIIMLVVAFLVVGGGVSAYFLTRGTEASKDTPGGPGPDVVVEYVVSFDTQGGTSIGYDTVTLKSDNPLLAMPEYNPLKAGFVFDGWYKNQEATMSWNFETDKVEQNLTLYAGYQEDESGIDTVVVEFDTQGGSFVPAVLAERGGLVTVPQDPQKDSFVFDMWYTPGQDRYYDKWDFDNDVVTDNQVLYARWDTIPPTVAVLTFVNPDGQQYRPRFFDKGDVVSSADLPKPTKKGHDFLGWFLDEALTNKLPSQYVIDSNQTLFAGFVAQVYSITYKDKFNVGYSGENADGLLTQHTYGTDTVLVDGVKTGVYFSGWYKDAQGKEPLDNSSGNFVIGAEEFESDITLYADWAEGKYYVQYDSNKPSGASNEVTGSMANSELYVGASGNLNRNQYAIKGWKFDSWNANPDGSGTVYRDGATVLDLTTQVNEVVVIYAQWIPEQYTIRYDGNKPSEASSDLGGSTGDTLATYDQDAALANNGFTVSGWSFVEWNTQKDGSGTAYQTGDSVRNLVDSGSVSLYAQWSVNNYKVIFANNKPANASNDVTGTMADQNFVYEKEQTLIANAYKLTGWDFVGWNTNEDGSGKSYQDKQAVSNLAPQGDTYLYAQWRGQSGDIIIINEYDDSFHEEMTVQVTYDQALPKLAVPKRRGYDFVGVFANKNGSGQQIYDITGEGTTPWNLTDDFASVAPFYMVWQAQTYTITLDYKGGRADDDFDAPTTHTFDTQTILPLASFGETLDEDTDQAFNGWYYEDQYQNLVYFNPDQDHFILTEREIDTDIVLYAKWHTLVGYRDVTDGAGVVEDSEKEAPGLTKDFILFIPEYVQGQLLRKIADEGFRRSTPSSKDIFYYVGYRGVQYVRLGNKAFENTNMKIARVPWMPLQGMQWDAFPTTVERFVVVYRETQAYFSSLSGKAVYFQIGQDLHLVRYAVALPDETYTLETFKNESGVVQSQPVNIVPGAITGAVNLKEIVLPPSMRSIGDDSRYILGGAIMGTVFDGATSLETITSYAPVVKLMKGIWGNDVPIQTINVPVGTIDAYKNPSTGGDFSLTPDTVVWNEITEEGRNSMQGTTAILPKRTQDYK